MRDKTTPVPPLDADDHVYPDDSDDPSDPYGLDFDDDLDFDSAEFSPTDFDDTPYDDVGFDDADFIDGGFDDELDRTDDSGSIEDDLDVPIPQTTSVARSFFDWAVVVVVALVVALLIRTFLLAHFVVDGTSMYSTLHDHDRVFVNKLSYDLHSPNRGDVVVLHERSGDRDLIKRVIALPGETIEMTNCEVRIDGQLLNEPYLDPTVVTPGNCGPDQPALLVPDNSVFVMGDNRPGSQDSRYLGPIEYDDVVGRAFVVFWPRADWQWL